MEIVDYFDFVWRANLEKEKMRVFWSNRLTFLSVKFLLLQWLISAVALSVVELLIAFNMALVLLILRHFVFAFFLLGGIHLFLGVELLSVDGLVVLGLVGLPLRVLTFFFWLLQTHFLV